MLRMRFRFCEFLIRIWVVRRVNMRNRPANGGQRIHIVGLSRQSAVGG